MRKLSERMYPAVRDATFFESCGVADLIATCYGGCALVYSIGSAISGYCSNLWLLFN